MCLSLGPDADADFYMSLSLGPVADADFCVSLSLGPDADADFCVSLSLSPDADADWDFTWVPFGLVARPPACLAPPSFFHTVTV